MAPFLELALRVPERRLVLLGAASIERGGPLMGAVHAYLAERAAQWVVLRPSWFMQNFAEGYRLAGILDEGAIYSATGDGAVGFIDADDIAAVAAAVLVRPEIPNGDLVLTGPAALTYDEVASAIGLVSGAAVRHVRLAPAELSLRFEAAGLPKPTADMLAAADVQIAGGSEARTTGAVETVTGRPPRSFAAFAAATKDVWSKSRAR